MSVHQRTQTGASQDGRHEADERLACDQTVRWEQRVDGRPDPAGELRSPRMLAGFTGVGLVGVPLLEIAGHGARRSGRCEMAFFSSAV